MSSTEILDQEHEQVLLEIEANRLAAERRHAVPGYPWGCDGSGWHEIPFSELDPLDLIPLPSPAVIVLPWLILFACECNSSAGGGVRRWPEWHVELNHEMPEM